MAKAEAAVKASYECHGGEMWGAAKGTGAKASCAAGVWTGQGFKDAKCKEDAGPNYAVTIKAGTCFYWPGSIPPTYAKCTFKKAGGDKDDDKDDKDDKDGGKDDGKDKAKDGATADAAADDNATGSVALGASVAAALAIAATVA